MRYALIATLVSIGCYTAPDYSGTHFKCDDMHACPSGQMCVNGLCGGSGSNMPDAQAGANGVLCGTTTCTSTQKCCADFTAGPSCIPLATTCTGLEATCDGKEDCGTGLCCSQGSSPITCAANCASGQPICRENADCPSQLSQCCPALTTFEPWGRCNAACP